MRRLQRDRKAEAVAETLKFMLAWFCAGLAIVGILPGDMARQILQNATQELD